MPEPQHEFVAVAQLKDVPPGTTKFVEVAGTPVALCNVEGRMFAVGNVCTHDGGPLSGGTLEGHVLECPRHGAKFDVRDGRVLCLPAPLPIPTYEVKIEGDAVQVKID